MSTATVTKLVSAQSAIESNNAKENKQEEKTVTIVVTPETEGFLKKAFEIQDNYENESKFNKEACELAVKSFLKQTISRAVAMWERQIDAYSQDHVSLTREQCIKNLLDSKKMRDIKKLADLAVAAKKTL